jgi:hypothetical protein
MVALLNTHKGANYGIPDFSCRRINDGAVRTNHSGLFETARMVIAKSQRCSATCGVLGQVYKAVSRLAFFGCSSQTNPYLNWHPLPPGNRVRPALSRYLKRRGGKLTQEARYRSCREAVVS